jgi:hypothetical protein
VEALILVGGDAVRRARRIDPRREERLVRVDVPYSHDVPLIHEHLLDGLARASERGGERVRGEVRVERLGPERVVVLPPGGGVEQEDGAEAADVAVDELAAVVERRPQHGVAPLVRVERAVVDHEVAGHARLDHEAAGARRHDRVLGAARHLMNLGAPETRGETAAGDAAQHVVVGERGPQNPPPRETGPQVAHDGLDFRQLGHPGKK